MRALRAKERQGGVLVLLQSTVRIAPGLIRRELPDRFEAES